MSPENEMGNAINFYTQQIIRRLPYTVKISVYSKVKDSYLYLDENNKWVEDGARAVLFIIGEDMNGIPFSEIPESYGNPFFVLNNECTY